MDFDINEALKFYLSDPLSIPTPEADGTLVDCEGDPESLTPALVTPVLNGIVDAVAASPEALARPSHMDSLQYLLKCASPDSLLFGSSSSSSSASCLGPLSSAVWREPVTAAPLGLPQHSEKLRALSSSLRTRSKQDTTRYTPVLPPHILSKMFDLVMSGLAAAAEAAHHDLDSPTEDDDRDIVAHHKQLLEMYAFLLQWTIECVEAKAAEKPSAAPVARGRGKTKKAAGTGDANWDSAAQLQGALDTMCKVLKLKLSKVFVTTSEKDTFISLLTRPVYRVLESEQRVKSTSVRMHAFKVLCMAIKHHGHAYGRFVWCRDVNRESHANNV